MLKEKIKSDLVKAVKEKNRIISSVLRFLLADLLNKEKEKRYKIGKKETELNEEELKKKTALTDQEIIKIIFSEIKKRKEAVSEYQKAGRSDLAEKEKSEAEVLKEYLPEQLSEEEVEKIVREAIEKIGAREIKDIGGVMAELTSKIKGRADLGEASKIVKKLLLKLR